MAEIVQVWQNSLLETMVRTPAVEKPGSEEMQPVVYVHELSPYTMMLSSLGTCTSIVLHTYAQNHEIDLEEVEIWLEYDRVFKEDCLNCEAIERYDERIREEIFLKGQLSTEERNRLAKVAHACPIYRMFLQGIDIETIMVEERK